MNKFTLILGSFIFICFANAQSNVPNFVTFQGVARNANGVTVDSQAIIVQLIYTIGSLNGPLFFNCSFQKTTNSLGEFTVQVSDNSPDKFGGTACNYPFSPTPFSSIPWDTANIFLTVAFSDNNGSTWDTLGNLQLGATYYAFVAKQAESVINFNLPVTPQDGQIIQYDAASKKWIPGTNSWHDYAIYQLIDTQNVVPNYNSYSIVPLNYTQDSAGSSITRSGSAINLAPGSYYVQGFVSEWDETYSVLGLFINGQMTSMGTVVEAPNSGFTLPVPINGIVNVNSFSQLQLEINMSSINSGGVIGNRVNVSNPGGPSGPNVAAQIMIQKIK